MKTVKGDLIKLALEGEFDVIVHGCNCFVTMGAGIASQIRRIFPSAYRADIEYSKGMNEMNKLGTLSSAKIEFYNNPDEMTEKTGEVTVVNAYTQFNPGRDLSYSALRLCLHKINHIYAGKKIGLPQIGCGIAGGDWVCVHAYIVRELKDCDVTIVEYDPRSVLRS